MDQIFIKLNSSKSLQNSLTTDNKSEQKLKELKEVSKQFESIFINQLLKQARDAKISKGILDSNGEDTFNSMIDQNTLKFCQKNLILNF